LNVKVLKRARTLDREIDKEAIMYCKNTRIRQRQLPPLGFLLLLMILMVGCGEDRFGVEPEIPNTPPGYTCVG